MGLKIMDLTLWRWTMYKAEFTLKTITPLFMYGADGKTPEIRASEFKGMIRFWWRAARYEDNLNNLYKEVYKKEQKIFGGSDEKVGKSKVNIGGSDEKIGKSRITIRIKDYHKEENNIRPLPHSESKRFTFKSILSNKLIIELSSFSAEKLNISKNTFILAVLLGGFGKRSRRGFGSFEILKINDDEFNCCNDNSLLNLLKDKLNGINGNNNAFEIENSSIVNSKIRDCSNNSTLNYPWIQKIYIGNALRDDINYILKQIGKASHDNNHDSLGYAYGKKRHSSPIYVSVVKVNNEYRIISTILNSKFNKCGRLTKEQQSFLNQIGIS